MSILSPYILPVKGLKPGQHEYTYTVNDEFFAAFPESPVQRANLELSILVDKKYGELAIRFDFAGTMATQCTRCLSDLDYPVSGSDKLVVQIVNDESMESTDPLLVYLAVDEYVFDLAPFAYEFMLLGLPLTGNINCQMGDPPKDCDPEMLAYIGQPQTKDENDSATESAPSPWDVLKSLNTDNNS